MSTPFTQIVDAINSGVKAVALSKEFITTLDNKELAELLSIILSVGVERGVNFNIHKEEISPEAQCENLREKYGAGGTRMLDLPETQSGKPAFELPFELIETASGFKAIDFGDTAINGLFTVTLSDMFTSNNIYSAYRIGDRYQLYVKEVKPEAAVYFRNDTLATTYQLNTTLESIAEWYKVRIKVLLENNQLFHRG